MRLPPEISQTLEGLPLNEEGYFLNESALQYLVADAESWEKTSEAWMAAYYEMSDRHLEYVSLTKEKILQLEQQINDERESWKKEIKAAKRKRIQFGLFGGYGYSSNGGEAVVGVGFVLPIF